MKRLLLALLVLACNGTELSAKKLTIKKVTINDIKYDFISNKVAIDPSKLINHFCFFAFNGTDIQTIRETIYQLYAENPAAFGIWRMEINDFREKVRLKIENKENSLASYVISHLDITIKDLIIGIKNDHQQKNPEGETYLLCTQILKIFDELGIKQALSAQQGDIIEQYEKERCKIHYGMLEPSSESIEKRIALLMRLAAVSNIELPEDLRN